MSILGFVVVAILAFLELSNHLPISEPRLRLLRIVVFALMLVWFLELVHVIPHFGSSFGTHVTPRTEG